MSWGELSILPMSLFSHIRTIPELSAAFSFVTWLLGNELKPCFPYGQDLCFCFSLFDECESHESFPGLMNKLPAIGITDCFCDFIMYPNYYWIFHENKTYIGWNVLILSVSFNEFW